MVAQVKSAMRYFVVACGLLLVLTLAAQAEAPLAELLILYGTVRVDALEANQAGTPYKLGEGQVVQTDDGARAMLKTNGGAYVLMSGRTKLKTGVVQRLVDGKFLLVPQARVPLAIQLPQAVVLQVVRPTRIFVGAEGLVRCEMSTDAENKAGQALTAAKQAGCLRFRDGVWEPSDFVPARSIDDWLSAFAVTGETGFEMALAPKKDDADSEAEGAGGGGSDDERGGSGESMCLDSAGGGDAAADSISGDTAGVEIEHGKAVIRVNVSWEE